MAWGWNIGARLGGFATYGINGVHNMCLLSGSQLGERYGYLVQLWFSVGCCPGINGLIPLLEER